MQWPKVGWEIKLGAAKLVQERVLPVVQATRDLDFARALSLTSTILSASTMTVIFVVIGFTASGLANQVLRFVLMSTHRVGGLAEVIASFVVSIAMSLALWDESRRIASRNVSVVIGNKTIERRFALAGLVICTVLYSVIAIIYLPFEQATVGRRPYLWIFYLWAVQLGLVAPVVEEFFFRGWLWTALRQKSSIITTMIVTSAIWILGHITAGVESMILLVPAAALIAAARHLTGSSRGSAFVHVALNVTALVMPHQMGL